MIKNFIYNKQTKKVTMVTEADITFDTDIFDVAKIDITDVDFKDKMANNKYLFYDDGLKVIIPSDVATEQLKVKTKSDITKSMKDPKTSTDDLKSNILKLIDIRQFQNYKCHFGNQFDWD